MSGRVRGASLRTRRAAGATAPVRRRPHGREAVAALAATVALALPGVARACAVCGLLNDVRTRGALLGATIFMSLLPLAAIGVGLWWLARRAGKGLREEFRESPDATAPEPGAEPRRS